MKKYFLLFVFCVSLIISGYIFVIFFLRLEIPVLPFSAVFLDANGKEIGELIHSGSIRHREITAEEIPEFYKKSLVALEDRSFWTNNGVSLEGIIRSAIRNMEAGKVVEWGTTISSGLIRNIFWISESRTVRKKILEFLYALRLNKRYTKEEILTAYINRVGFGYMNYGLKSAAKYYFDREPKNLTQAEQIALLLIPRDPKKYDPFNKPKNFRERFEAVTNTLRESSIITEEERKSLLHEKLSWNRNHENSLPYVLDFLKTRSGIPEKNPIVFTSFDSDLTEKIDTIARNALTELAWKNVSDYGILIAERGERHENPKLRVMIGGIDYRESTAGQVNTTLALRQPGSTIKPFTYAIAFQKLGLTPESTILDLPVAYKTIENYAYEPKNYSQTYKGEITLRQALSESINIPAVKLTEQIGVTTLLDFLRWLGITSLEKDANHYGLGLTLGNGEVSLLELLQEYTIFTNDGKYCPFAIIKNTPPSLCIQKIPAEYTDMVSSILTDHYAKLGDFPLHSALNFQDRKVFVKTGTSRNFRDNYSVGFTDRYMIGVWTGNKNGEDMKGVSGATGAGEIFRRIVYALDKTEEQQSPKKLKAKEQFYLTITNPLEGSLYREESREDKGNEQQIQLRFKTNISYETIYWILDGTKTNSDFIDLFPWNHTIEIVLIKDGEILKKEKSAFRVESAE